MTFGHREHALHQKRASMEAKMEIPDQKVHLQKAAKEAKVEIPDQRVHLQKAAKETNARRTNKTMIGKNASHGAANIPTMRAI